MHHHEKPLEDMLVTLGTARREGVFVGKPHAYPWQASRAGTNSLARGFRWVRVALPLAAAAAVAVVFVGPGLFGNRAVQEGLQNDLAATSPEHPEALVDAGPVTTDSWLLECDYNGDGVVDAKDIQAFLDRMHDANGDPLLQAEHLQRCLLGS